MPLLQTFFYANICLLKYHVVLYLGVACMYILKKKVAMKMEILAFYKPGYDIWVVLCGHWFGNLC